MLLVTPVAAQLIVWQPNWAQFFGYGSCVCENADETIPDCWGNTCYFGASGAKMWGGWNGRGFWRDVDWHEGVLAAVLEITDASQLGHDPEPGHITEIFQLAGQARVYINGVYKGTYNFGLHMFDADASVNPPGIPGNQPDLVGFTLFRNVPGPPPNWWYQSGINRISGEIVTWWYPAYSG